MQFACTSSTSAHSPTLTLIRIAVDAMGGDHAPAAAVDGAVAAARHLAIQIALVGSTPALEAALAPHADWRDLGLSIVEAPDVVGMADPPAATLRRRPRASIRVAADLVARHDAAALFSAGQYRRNRDGGPRRIRHDSRRRSARPRHDHSHAAAPRRCCSIQAPTSSAGRTISSSSRSWAASTRASRSAWSIPRVGLLSIGEEETKGNELTRDAHQLLKTAALNFIGNVEGREIYSGSADVIVCDGFTGNVVLKTSEGLVDAVEALLGDELQGTFFEPGRATCCRGGRSAASGAASTIRSLAAHRSSASRVSPSSATADRPPRPCATPSPWRTALPAATSFHASSRKSPPLGYPVPSIDRISFPRSGSRRRSAWARTSRTLSRGPSRSFDEADAALGEPLSRLCFEGPEDQLTLTENTQPAILTMSTAAFRVCWRSRGIEPAFVAGHSLGEYSANVAAGTMAFADALHRAAARALHAGSGAGRRGRHGGDSRPRAGARAAGVRRGGGRAGREPGQHQRTRTGRHCGRHRGGEARLGARQGAGRQAGDSAAGQRALSLRDDEAGRRSAWRPSCARWRSAIRGCRSSPTWTPSRSATRRRRSRRWFARSPPRCNGNRWSGALRLTASPRMLRWARGGAERPRPEDPR